MKAVLLLCVMALATSHHVVFEDIGEIATSITYIHVAIPLNLTTIRNLAHHFGNARTLTADPKIHFRKNNVMGRTLQETVLGRQLRSTS